MTCDVKSPKIEYLSRLFLYRTETFTVVAIITKFHEMSTDISMATQCAPGPLHSKGKIRVFFLQEVLFALVVNSVGVNEYGHYTSQAQESPLNSGTTNKVFFNLERERSGSEYVAMVTPQPLPQ